MEENRFLLFEYDDYYPGGGPYDYVASFSDLRGAMAQTTALNNVIAFWDGKSLVPILHHRTRWFWVCDMDGWGLHDIIPYLESKGYELPFSYERYQEFYQKGAPIESKLDPLSRFN